jgi:hypothetical protein
VKFSVRQILASVVGAVLAAFIASSFGVTGTIIGVAIGSAVATIGTALVAQSIERGHEAVKQVAVRAPDTSLLRRLGGTDASGQSQATVHSPIVPPESVPTAAGSVAAGDETASTESALAAGDTQRLEVSAVAEAPATERFEAVTLPPKPVRRRRFSWPAIAGTAAVVFLLALALVTAIELIAGQATVKDIFVPSPAPTTTTTPASTTTTTGAATTTTSTTTTTTTTTPANSGSTTTTAGAGGTGTTTTTAGAGGTTTTSAPG